ncbi:hypothetical protein MTR_3g055360 [Medicago truncatula]|uniref:Uncharacterized protein n=1 Tax=Medicago truncatula TaxID=3880 RepID=G7J048_MEDTR|nr:hypothetical protein MTR_3g055360 [Medicago truncatula]
MKLEADISEQISGHAPNQAGSQLPELTQLNGNALPSQMSSLGASTLNMDPQEFLRARAVVRDGM